MLLKLKSFWENKKIKYRLGEIYVENIVNEEVLFNIYKEIFKFNNIRRSRLI